eukprot:g17164.t1
MQCFVVSLPEQRLYKKLRVQR